MNGEYEETYFDKAFNFVLKHEGGVSYDRWGGKTIYGISSENYPSVFKLVYSYWEKGEKEKALEHAKRFYRNTFWETNNCNNLYYPLNVIFFDTAVNMGVIRAGNILQRTLNLMGFRLEVDGIVGPKTLRAVYDAKAIGRDLLYLYLFVRLDTYFKRSDHREYWRGYFNRCFDLVKKFILEVEE